jgi:hypothetical protein
MISRQRELRERSRYHTLEILDLNKIKMPLGIRLQVLGELNNKIEQIVRFNVMLPVRVEYNKRAPD